MLASADATFTRHGNIVHGRADFATMLGRVHQGSGGDVHPPPEAVLDQRAACFRLAGRAMITADAGIGWQPAAYPFAQFFLGYHFDTGGMSAAERAIRGLTLPMKA